MQKCVICNSEQLSKLVEISEIPIYCNLLFTDRQEAIDVPRGSIILYFCPNCQHVYNCAFDPAIMEYDQSYENSLHFSSKFNDFAVELSKHLVEKYDIANKKIIDIGCGKGDFLKIICDIGGNTGFGFDKSYVAEPEHEAYENITFVQDFYSDKYSNYEADLVVCRHVLEHIENPGDFLIEIRNAVQNREKTVIYFEVPNAEYTVEREGIWDLIYEHCSYFTSSSLVRLFNENGFEVMKIRKLFDEQYLGIEAMLQPSPYEKKSFETEKLSISDVNKFSELYANKISSFIEKLARIKSDDKKVVIWGAGSKGVTFLNVIDKNRQIEYVVDINPKKQGKYVAGTGQKIISPADLESFNPEYIIIMNQIYEDEIRKILNENNINPELIFA